MEKATRFGAFHGIAFLYAKESVKKVFTAYYSLRNDD